MNWAEWLGNSSDSPQHGLFCSKKVIKVFKFSYLRVFLSYHGKIARDLDLGKLLHSSELLGVKFVLHQDHRTVRSVCIFILDLSFGPISLFEKWTGNMNNEHVF